MQFLQQYQEGKIFLQQIVTEKHGCAATNLQANIKAWRGRKHISAQDQEIQQCAFCCQNDVHTIWDFKGPILNYYKDHWQMVNIAWYCAMLEEKLEPTICSKHRGMLINCFTS
jgi:hypothetical protein